MQVMVDEFSSLYQAAAS
ncbi:hypothetical protein, partial [Pseudomonas mandelii]